MVDTDCNDFNQQEQSDGEEITGQYSVLLPDGRVQTVTYSVRPETGYVVSREIFDLRHTFLIYHFYRLLLPTLMELYVHPLKRLRCQGTRASK